MCEVLGVAWLKRPISDRAAYDAKLVIAIGKSFGASDRNYGARRVWRDVLEDGLACGLHRIERLMRLNAMRARPKRRRTPKNDGQRSIIADNILDRDVACSMSRVGNVWNNSAMESFFSSLKAERTARKVYRTRDDARADVLDYIERFYNPRRRYLKLAI